MRTVRSTITMSLWSVGVTLFLVILQSQVTVITAQEGRCEEIQVPMCKGQIPYNMTKLPNRFGHTTQAEAYWALQPWWPFMDAGCSDNIRTFLCGLYLPRCMGDNNEAQYPCSETCKKSRIRCRRQMRQQSVQWRFQCSDFLPKKSRRCIRPVRETRKKTQRTYVLCETNRLSMCSGIPFSQGSLPNMFLQADQDLIDVEMQQFIPLMNSGCSNKFRFFLCGAYMPFCVPGSSEVTAGGQQSVVQVQPDVPFVVPCQELCQEVYDQCSGEYQQRTGGLPWPGKFHCHRYPSFAQGYVDSSGNSSVTPGSGIPCTMMPRNYDGN